jgi:hypothetical protein
VRTLCVAALLGGCQSSEVSGPLGSKSGLLAWCGEELCDWTVEEGSVERVPTWHEQEFGARLDGELTVLSSEWTPPVGQTLCFELALTSLRLAPPELEVTLQADDEPAVPIWYVPPSHYESRQHWFELPEPPTILRIEVTKRGGDAVLAYLTLAELVPIDGC